MVNAEGITLSDSAYQRLRREILLGILAPGDVVSERELASRYDMSKTPIREAVTQVCREGLMQRLPGRGYLVSPITIKEIQDLYDMRLILEMASLDSLIEDPSLLSLEKLKKIKEVKYTYDDPNSHIEFLEANREFHLTIAAASGNERLVRALENVLFEMGRLFHLGLRLRDFSTEMAREHKDLVAAIEKEDWKTAREMVRAQILNSKNRIIEAIMRGDISQVQAIG